MSGVFIWLHRGNLNEIFIAVLFLFTIVPFFFHHIEMDMCLYIWIHTHSQLIIVS